MVNVNENKPLELSLVDFGVRPDSGEDAGPGLRRAIAAAKRHRGPVKLAVAPGRYDFHPESADRVPYYVTNTASEEENPDPVKTIAIWLKDMNDFELDGGGSLFVFYGKMTMLALDGCVRTTIRDVGFDYSRPTVVEMTIDKLGEGFMDVTVHADTRYDVHDGKLRWVGDGWSFLEGPVQAYDPIRDATWRIGNVLARAAKVEETAPGRIRFFYEGRDSGEALEAGWVLQARDGIRDQVGAFIHRCKDVRWERVGVHFMHGLGIVGQFSENLNFRQLNLSPRPETGRTVAAFADFVHLSGCRGVVEIADSVFSGAHDDAINVHGTHLRIVGAPTGDELAVRFMHPQTYGFEAFGAGDEIEFVRPGTLLPYATGRVKEARLTEPRVMLLKLEDRLPEGIGEGDVIENVTWTPELRVTGCSFSRIPTRGVLATTRRPVVLASNVFKRLRMSAVLVADDAASWYESGRVEDLTIRDNRFVACGEPGCAVISIMPENEEVDEDAPVHRNIRVAVNVFETSRASFLLEAKSTQGIAFFGNEIRSATGPTAPEDTVRLLACSDVDVRDNCYHGME
ncbi:alpha-1,3-galactosidase-related protein [Cohnella terricola]|uniref:Right-handed parallel beta-helix repeat-containing protein n=1 Tax=Cohnella terricola TaxID=1289167 RepID=A0A559J9C3_9BACL|nr:right-handed parallel beta-helix repeat-containing protein [Cohnella terricola]TVX96480.1 right-handed parallel beta-helix repeat-containing protein [Cohnella terricola]